MKNKRAADNDRMLTGVRNLDTLLNGGLPQGTITALGGAPGTGKTILTQQIAFHNATPESPALFFQTLSEPTIKTLRYLKQLSFFSQEKLDKSAHFVDLGAIMRNKGLEKACEMVMTHIKRIRPGIVVIDSFKAFSDLAGTNEELRKFSYEVIVNLVAWECTAFLLGEYSEADIQTSPIFSIIDGLIMLSASESSGEQQRFLQVVKMRGTDHNRNKHPLVISSDGVDVYSPRETIRRDLQADRQSTHGVLRKTGISTFDRLLAPGIPSGYSLLISGATGTGKTLFTLEAIYRGAKQFNEKGIIFSFEETEERLIATARSLGMNLERELKRGMIEIVHITQPDILVEKNLQMMHERIKAMRAKRIAIDSVSVFLHKIKDPQIAREKVFQLATLVQMAQAIGFFVTDVPFGSSQISHFGVEETVVDGIVLLTSMAEPSDRQRYLEVYKLRNTAHAKGRNKLEITSKGLLIETPSKPRQK